MSNFLLALSALLAGWFLWYRRSSARKLPLPPGPPRLPILGNALDMPSKNLGEDYRPLTDKYGDLVYLNVFGQSLLLLGSHETAVDLLDKRSALYSDRIYSPIVEMGGFEWVMTMLHYGPWWRRHRRAFHQFFNPNAIVKLRPMQCVQVNRFLIKLVEKPEAFADHIRHLFAATIMRVAYGIDVAEENDEYVAIAEAGLAAFSTVLVPGKYLVELFPVLRFLPGWFPGVQFKRDASVAKVAAHRLRDVAWERTLAAMREGTAAPSMATVLMDRISGQKGTADEEAADEEIVARNTVAVAYGGGADTTLSSIQALFLILASFPEAQKKAQAELDAVIGPGRLPDFDDQDALPYVSAVVKECLRWHSIVPLCVPHRLIQDDEYRGLHIPKGTLVIPNIWAYSHDPARYPDPDAFKPERFLREGKIDPDVTDPADFAFGYGRRVCPGRYFAETSLFLIVSSVLHTLAVSAPLDAAGNPVRPEGKMTAGVISYPEQFECIIKPRAPWAEALIRANDQAATAATVATA